MRYNLRTLRRTKAYNSLIPDNMKKILIILSFLIFGIYFTVNSGLVTDEQSFSAPEYSQTVKRRIVLITLDTLRYDHLGYSGYEKNTTPNIDAFSRKSVYFTNAFSALPTTDPAHTSIMTGLYPRVHGVMGNGYGIFDDNAFSLAQWAKDFGIDKTAAIVSRTHLNPDDLGLKGFDYISSPEDERKADATFKIVKEWLKENGKDSFFLWIHYFDPHYDYDSPYPFNSLFNDGYRGQIPKDREFLDDPPLKYNNREIDYMTSLYDGEIAFLDYYFGKTVKEIEKYTGSEDVPPLYIVASDHGEDMAELQEKEVYAFDHGEFLFNPTIKVLTVIRWDGKIDRNKKISYPIQQIDIAPTVVDLLGDDLSRYDAFNGESLARFLNKGGDVNEKRSIFVQRRKAKTILRPFLAEEQIAVISMPWKLIASFPSGKTELYNLETDSGELNNLSPENTVVADSLLNEIKVFRKKYPYAYARNDEIPAGKARDLKALGYVQ